MDPNLGPQGAPVPAQARPFPPIDQDLARRPGVPKERPPQPWPNARSPIQRMTAKPSVPKHGRPNKTMPPVYGTAVPLHGLSGLVRRAAYRIPDHRATHWTTLLLADRVDSWTHRARKLLWFGAPAVVAVLVLRRFFEER